MDQLKLDNQKLVDCEAKCKTLEVEIRDKKLELHQYRKQMLAIREKISDLIKNSKDDEGEDDGEGEEEEKEEEETGTS